MNKDIISEVCKYLNLKDKSNLRNVNKLFNQSIRCPSDIEIENYLSEKYIEKSIKFIGLENNEDILTDIIRLLYFKKKITIEQCIKFFKNYSLFEEMFVDAIKLENDAILMFHFLINKYNFRHEVIDVINHMKLPLDEFKKYCIQNTKEFFGDLKEYASLSEILLDIFDYS